MRYLVTTLFMLIFSTLKAQIKTPVNIDVPESNSSEGMAVVALSPAFSIGANELWQGGSTGLNVSGNGMYVGVWEAFLGSNTQINSGHSDLTGRVTIKDANGNSSHATTVGLIIASSGGSTDRGIADSCNLLSYNITTRFTEMETEAYPGAANNILVSNHSYANTAGWGVDLPGCTDDGFWGVTEISPSEDYKFGRYSSDTDLWDDQYDNSSGNEEYLTIVKAAGNDRGSFGDSTYARYSYAGGTWPVGCGLTSPVPERDGGDDGYDCIPAGAMGKNVLTIGACNLLSTFPPDTSEIILDNQSGWGPADDGRIKPDLVAPGDKTSHSTPVVSGVVVLLQEAYYNIHTAYMTSATVRGLLCHTASEAGNTAGPDYKHGWGMVNAYNAALVVNNSDGKNYIKESNLEDGDTNSYYFYSDGSDAKISLSWTDIEGSPAALTYTAADLNDRTAMLVNDLDLRLIKVCDSTEYRPYKLDPDNPANAATKSDNTVDNLEIIHESSLTAGWYEVKIYHKGTLYSSAAQNYSLITTGLTIPLIYTGTWSGGSSPDSTDAIVVNTNYTIASATNLEAKHALIIDGISISFTDASSTFTVGGDISGWGDANISGNGKLILDKNNAKLCGSLTVSNLDLNKVSGKSLTIGTGSNALKITSLLDLQSGTLNSNGNLTLKADSTANREGYAQIMDNGGLVSGNITFEAYILGNSDWRHISSPVTTTLNDFTKDFNFYKLNNGASIQKWNAVNSEWTNVSATSEIVNANTAWSLYFGNTTDTTFTSLPHLITLTGNVHSGNITQPLNYSTPVDSSTFVIPTEADGWNVVANPYPSGLDWDEVNNTFTTAHNNSYYIYDSNHGTPQFYSHNGSIGTGDLNGIIAPAQAFFIKLDSSPSSGMDLTNAMRTSSKSKIYKKDPVYIKLEARDKENNTDIVALGFDEASAVNFDNATDAYKLYGKLEVQLYSTTIKENRNIPLSINSVPVPTTYQKFTIGFTSTEKRKFTLGINQMNVDPNWEIWLLDKKNNSTTDLVLDDYIFDHDPNNEANRFVLFAGPELNKTELTTTSKIIAYQSNGHVQIGPLDPNEKSVISIYNLSGKLMYREECTAQDYCSVATRFLNSENIILIHVEGIEYTASIKMYLRQK